MRGACVARATRRSIGRYALVRHAALAGVCMPRTRRASSAGISTQCSRRAGSGDPASCGDPFAKAGQCRRDFYF
ncbi:hypothetical protein WG70_02745 [Burkholderia oklahomensis EO147]|nr:hypothetical protein WG70_02745 [Burkholderia oklahomensis EO147]KUY53228.1 hypothetical protein WG70_13925 [Burkholderia oklahomensis EO147]